jgi:small nuclear ribonucleoprotein (snRNP)-like protein
MWIVETKEGERYEGQLMRFDWVIKSVYVTLYHCNCDDDTGNEITDYIIPFDNIRVIAQIS